MTRRRKQKLSIKPSSTARHWMAVLASQAPVAVARYLGDSR